jgi:hypothetical protein
VEKLSVLMIKQKQIIRRVGPNHSAQTLKPETPSSLGPPGTRFFSSYPGRHLSTAL